MEYKIRKLKKEDTNFFLATAKSYIVHNAQAYKNVAKEIGFVEVERHLKTKLDKTYVIVDELDDNYILGFISIDDKSSIKKVYACYVRPEYRGQGIASKLIKFFIPEGEAYLYCFPTHVFKNIKLRNKRAFLGGLEAVAFFYEKEGADE